MYRLFPVFLFLFYISCNPQDEQDIELTFEIEPRLTADENGYYHLEMDTTNWQTLHRISGHIYRDEEPAQFIKFHWLSSHYWIIGDTIGFIKTVWNCYTDECDEPWDSPTYIGTDTLFITYFSGMEVPTINSSSYSNYDGECNSMFVPVFSMRGDTVTISSSYFDERSMKSGEEIIQIVLD